MIPKLLIDGISIPITKELPVSANYAIADIRDMDKRGGSLTKTLQLAGSQEINILFENIFNVNIELNTYNPNKAVTAIYYINEKQQFKGDLQLLKILSKADGTREYQCNIVGREGGFFVAMGESLLTDLDFSDLDHTFNKTEQKNSWATSYRRSGIATAFSFGDGYVYPFIKYGYAASDTQFDVNHFKVALFAREIMTKIFNSIGYSWNTGGFFDSALFKRLIVPSNIDKIQLSATDIANSQYYIGKTTSGTLSLASGNTVGNTAAQNNIAVYPNYDLETGSYFDPSNQYDSVTNFYSVIASPGVYNVVALAQMDITINAASLPSGTWTSAVTFYDTYIEVDSGSGWVMKAAVSNPCTITTQNIGSSKSYNSSAQTGNIYLNAGDKVRVRTRIAVTASLFDSLSAPAANNTAYTMTYVLPTGTSKNTTYLLRTDTSVVDGTNLTMNNAIPQNIKQKDFVKWIFQLFNLYVEKDKVDENTLIIETRDNFYTNTVENWTAKVDYLKDWEQTPMGELDFRNFIMKYKDDKDFYNDKYQKQYVDNYGFKRLIIDNDFINNEKKNEIGFSPTPLVSNSSNSIICPHIYANDGTIKPVSHNIRLLYYSGLKSSGNAWTYTSTPSGSSTEYYYPYAGHVDDPLAPTIDLNFWYPREVYYTYPLAYFTTNNSYNAFYSKFINEVTDPNSKIITCFVNLDEIDIQKFTFRNLVWIDHPEYGAAYYVVNKIVDYNPHEKESTKVELLKLKNYSAFVPGTIPIDASFDPITTARISYNPLINSYTNIETSNTVSVGSNNRVMGSGNSSTGGSDNFISESSSGISLTNCNRVAVIGVTNFVCVGLSDRAFEGSSYNNQTITNVMLNEQTQTSSFSVDPSVDIYYIDATGGNITATFDRTTQLKPVTFKRMDGSGNLFKIDEISGGALYDGNVLPHNMALAQYGTAKVTTNGTDLLSI